MDDQDQHVNHQTISQEILINPPPNHNPLIGLLHGDTLINVHDSLSTLQELTVSPPNGELCLSSTSSNGLYFLMCCIKDALRFEINHRDKLNRELESKNEKRSDDFSDIHPK